MSDTHKTEIRFFTIPEWQKEQDYLRERHKQGWRFTYVSFFGIYHFEKCTPEDVIYQLDYPEKNTNKAAYIQMFHDCGWEYLQDFFGYSYFRKPVSEMNEEEEIFGDLDSRTDFLKRVIRSRLTPLFILFFCVILPQFFLQMVAKDPFHHVVAGFYFFLIILYLFLFLWCASRFWKYLHK